MAISHPERIRKGTKNTIALANGQSSLGEDWEYWMWRVNNPRRSFKEWLSSHSWFQSFPKSESENVKKPERLTKNVLIPSRMTLPRIADKPGTNWDPHRTDLATANLRGDTKEAFDAKWSVTAPIIYLLNLIGQYVETALESYGHSHPHLPGNGSGEPDQHQS